MAGVAGRSGRKSKAEEMGLAALLDRCITPADREYLFRSLLRRAKSKDERIANEATKLLLAYLYGTPRQSLEVSGPGGGPVRHQVFDYATAVAAVAPGSEGDYQAPGQSQDSGDGPPVG